MFSEQSTSHIPQTSWQELASIENSTFFLRDNWQESFTNKETFFQDRFTFAYPGVGFGVRYEIKITSLPGYEKNDRSSNSITFTSPGEIFI